MQIRAAELAQQCSAVHLPSPAPLFCLQAENIQTGTACMRGASRVFGVHDPTGSLGKLQLFGYSIGIKLAHLPTKHVCVCEANVDWCRSSRSSLNTLQVLRCGTAAEWHSSRLHTSRSLHKHTHVDLPCSAQVTAVSVCLHAKQHRSEAVHDSLQLQAYMLFHHCLMCEYAGQRNGSSSATGYIPGQNADSEDL